MMMSSFVTLSSKIEPFDQCLRVIESILFFVFSEFFVFVFSELRLAGIWTKIIKWLLFIEE